MIMICVFSRSQAQTDGRKLVFLFSPQESERLYERTVLISYSIVVYCRYSYIYRMLQYDIL